MKAAKDLDGDFKFYTLHPTTGRPYRWAGQGHYSQLPVIPTELLTLWQTLATQDAERTIPTDTIAASWDDIQAALDCIPADCARDQWLTVAMALHHSGTQVNQLDQAMSIFHTWSATAQTKYKGPRDIEIVWRSFKADSGIKTGSLFHIAHEYGYKRPMPDGWPASARCTGLAAAESSSKMPATCD